MEIRRPKIRNWTVTGIIPPRYGSAFFPWPNGVRSSSHHPASSSSSSSSESGWNDGRSSEGAHQIPLIPSLLKSSPCSSYTNPDRCLSTANPSFRLLFFSSDHGGGGDTWWPVRGFSDNQGARTSFAVECPWLRAYLPSVMSSNQDRSFFVFSFLLTIL